MFHWSALPAPIASAYLWIFALHVAVTVAPFLIKPFRPHADFRDFWRRALGWWIVTGSLLGALLLGPYGTSFFFCGVALLALKELLAIAPVRLPAAFHLLAALGVVIQFALVATAGVWPSLLFMPLLAGLAVPALSLAGGPPEQYAQRLGTLQLALMVAGFSLSQVPALMFTPAARNPIGGGIGLVMYMVFLAQFNDFAQYVWGKLCGRTPIAPQLSPKKTWAGFLGGMGTVALLGYLLAPALTPLPRELGILLGAAIALSGYLGDLTISAMKRAGGVKDAGSLLPGFGGVMDRLDSLVYVAPLFLCFLRLWQGV